MTVSASSCYQADSLPVLARGYAYSAEELDALIDQQVNDILQDSSGNSEIEAILAGMSTTGFSNADIKSVLQSDNQVKDWVVGEAIAEAFLVGQHECEYPWPTSRDLKNPNASPAGCDLTGFQLTQDLENPYRFSFGEVKTSSDPDNPPSVAYSLSKQLFDLRDIKAVKANLVRYLALHSVGKTWLDKFKSAATRYFKSECSDVAIFGVLVRDTSPSEQDVKNNAIALAEGCPKPTDIVLLALYLPTESIAQLPSKVAYPAESGS